MSIEGDLGIFGNFGVVHRGVWKLGIVAHEKLRVCNRVYGETSGCFLGCVGSRSCWLHGVCSLFVLSFVSSFSTFSAFVRF